MKFKSLFIFYIGLILLILASNIIFAQETIQCEVVKKYSNGSYLIKVGNKEMLAITESMEKKMLKMNRDLLDAEQKLVFQDSLLANYHKTTAWYDTTIKNMKAYIAELESVLSGYKGLLKDYKKLRDPWVTVRWGIGATSEDYKPAILMGLGIRRLLISGFIQERNSGLLLGTQFRLF